MMKVLKMPILTKAKRDIFFSNFLITEDNNKCWEWVGHKDGRGYGTIKVKCVRYFAHRLSYFIHNNIDPDKLCVCHKCDNPSCVNPHHLFLGTKGDNARDMISKGRQNRKGEMGSKSKLTNRQVVEIVNKYLGGGYTYHSLGKEYGVSYGAIYAIVKGKSWTNLNTKAKNIPSQQKMGENHYRATLTESQIIEIRKMYNGVYGQIAILANKFNINRTSIRNIVQGRSWKHLLPKENVIPKINYAFGYINA